ncbi:DUF4129 domain-containing protein [Hoyosella sp. G463]|uniref:DUF4129 domain-containing protein n=1 Tax=Lolliginicoccus lacisalsi TaxID=2742202 RepID=A0A927JAP7_9ACTN|nr:DUF4129 domain-containing protein [Lolliginicoccus lacisalsi]MBD8504942.1 DUF4129 domain-containing protein [Lolliginicoccus lacisalsi]
MPSRTALQPPVEIARDPAGAAAREELSRPVYLEQRPSLLEQATSWLLEQLGRAINAALSGIEEASPSGAGSLLILAAVLIVGIVLVRWRAGRLRSSRTARSGRGAAPRATAHDHRLAAAAAIRAGDLATAIAERFRAITVSLEERGIIEDTRGSTAWELAERLGATRPAAADAMRAAARVLDDVLYGHRDATSTDYATIAATDEALATARASSEVSSLSTTEPPQ